MNEGFADPCLTTWPRRRINKRIADRNRFNLQSSMLERAMGFEPTTFSLARRRSTTELRPRCTTCLHGRECRDPGSNWGHRDFQSRALPTELSRPTYFVVKRGGFYTHLYRLSSKALCIFRSLKFHAKFFLTYQLCFGYNDRSLSQRDGFHCFIRQPS